MSNNHFTLIDTRQCVRVPTKEKYTYDIYFKKLKDVSNHEFDEYVFLMTRFLNDPKVKQTQTTLEQCQEVVRYYLISGGKEKDISIEIKPYKTKYVKEYKEVLKKEKEQLNG